MSSLIEKVNAINLGSQALQEASGGDRQAATQRLRQVATRLLDMGEAVLAGEMLCQAEALESGRQLDARATKKLRYETRQIISPL